MSENWIDKMPDLPYWNMSGGFIMGLAVGFVLKKSIKVLLFLLGVGLILLFVLDNQKIVVINEQALEHTVEGGMVQLKEFGHFLQHKLSTMHTATTGSTVAGFFAGLKIG